MNLAYEIAGEISECKTNVERGRFVQSVLERVAKETGRRFVKSPIPGVDLSRGAYNYEIISREDKPVLLTAHYDAVLRLEGSELTIPAANDNGSGVGAAIDSFMQLEDPNVGIVLFGAEETEETGEMIFFGEDRRGSKHYCNKSDLNLEFVMNFDCCGSGTGLAFAQRRMNFPDEAGELQRKYIETAREMGIKTSFNGGSSDHITFLQSGIPSGLILGKNKKFFPHGWIEKSAIYHTMKDTMDWVDPDFLEKAVIVGVIGTKRILDLQAKRLDKASGF